VADHVISREAPTHRKWDVGIEPGEPELIEIHNIVKR